MANTNLNLVTQQRKAAEVFLKEHQEIKKIPQKVSGIVCAKFGKYVSIWQYRNNKLVGAVSIDVNNIDALYKKLQMASKGFDYSTAKPESEEEEENDGQSEIDES